MLGSSGGENKTRYVATALIAGIIFALAWWVIIDAGAQVRYHDDPRQIKFIYVLPGILASFGVLMINSFSWEDFAGEGFSEVNAKRAKFCFFFGMVTLICTLFGALWVAIDYYFTSSIPKSDWPGAAIIINLFLQFVSAVVLRVGRLSH